MGLVNFAHSLDPYVGSLKSARGHTGQLLLLLLLL